MLIVKAPRFEFRLHRNRSVICTAQNRYLEQEVDVAANLSASRFRILVCAQIFLRLSVSGKGFRGRMSPHHCSALPMFRGRSNAPENNFAASYGHDSIQAQVGCNSWLRRALRMNCSWRNHPTYYQSVV
jgi:hypothetical protein